MPADVIADVLKDHKVLSHRSLTRDLDLYGRTHLTSFLEDLARLIPTPATKPGALSYLAAGGQFGMGSGERAARALLMVSDHIVLPFDLGVQASALLGRLREDTSGRHFAAIKRSLRTELYPYLIQYFRVQPLVANGLMSFVATSAPPRDLVHPLATKLAPGFVEWVRCGGSNERSPWLGLDIGPRHYGANPELRTAGGFLIPASEIASTDDLILMQQFGPIGAAQLDSSELVLSTSHPLHEAFEHFVSIELFRSQLLSETALKANAVLATDLDEEWRILNMLATTSETDEAISAAGTMAETVSESFPFLNHVAMEDLAKLRVECADEFDAFRAILLRAARVVAQEADDTKRRLRAREVLLTELSPAFAQYGAKVDEAAKSRLTNLAAASLSVGTFAMMVLLAGPEVFTATVAGTSAKAGYDFLTKTLKANDALNAAKGDPMYFLWKAKQLASTQTNP